MKSFWKGHFLTLILVFADVVAFSIIWRWTWEFRHASTEGFGQPINPFDNYRALLPRLLVVWLGIMAYFEHYSHRGKISSLNQMGNIIKAGLGIVIGTMCTAYLFKQHDLGRSVIFIASAGMTAYVWASRTALRRVKEFFVARGHGLTRVLIIGAGETGRKVAARIVSHPDAGYDLIGFVDRDPEKRSAEVEGSPFLGTTENLLEILQRHRIEEAFFAIPSLPQNEMFNLITECEQARVHFKVVTAGLLQVIMNRVKIDDIEDMPVIPLRDGHLTPAGALAKRGMDLALVLPAMPIILILMGVITLLIRKESKGSAIFTHERVGKDGRKFRMHKFRTMLVDADPYAIAPSTPDDPRITRIGRFLRKTSLDELPQFINVLKGEMSLVGPRPEMEFIVNQYEPWQRRRLFVPPGLTGLWQIAGRKRLPLHQNLEYDFYYIRNWSLILDMEIILKTLPSVLLSKGAF